MGNLNDSIELEEDEVDKEVDEDDVEEDFKDDDLREPVVDSPSGTRGGRAAAPAEPCLRVVMMVSAAEESPLREGRDIASRVAGLPSLEYDGEVYFLKASEKPAEAVREGVLAGVEGLAFLRCGSPWLDDALEEAEPSREGAILEEAFLDGREPGAEPLESLKIEAANSRNDEPLRPELPAPDPFIGAKELPRGCLGIWLTPDGMSLGDDRRDCWLGPGGLSREHLAAKLDRLSSRAACPV